MGDSRKTFRQDPRRCGLQWGIPPSLGLDEVFNLESFDKDGLFYQQQLAAALFKERIRRESKRLIEAEDLATHVTEEAPRPVMIYDPLPTSAPELIPGLMPEYGSMAIIGETNTGKSLLALEMASSLLSGEPLWGAITPNRTIQKVTFVLGEHTCSTLQGLYHRTQLPANGDFALVGPEHLHPYKALVVAGVQQQVAIDRLCRLVEGSQLVVFDPLAGFVQGTNAENDNATMRTLVDSMTLIASKVGAVSLILHHAGKPKMDDQGQEIRRTVYASRGASGIEDSLTHIFYLRRSIGVKQSGNVERFDLAVRKYKGSPSSEVFKLQRDPETIRNTLLGEKPMRRLGPTFDEKNALNVKYFRLKEANPNYTHDTLCKNLAAMEGYPIRTIKEWLGAAESTD